MSNDIRPEDITADTDPQVVEEAIVEDVREGDLVDALELGEAADEAGLERPADLDDRVDAALTEGSSEV